MIKAGGRRFQPRPPDRPVVAPIRVLIVFMTKKAEFIYP